MNTETSIPEKLREMGFFITSSKPSPGVDGDWPHIAFSVTVKRGETVIFEGPYKLGVGHVKVPKFDVMPANCTKDEVYAANTSRRKPYAKLADQMLHASLAAKLATAQKVSPKLEDVMNSILSDGEAFFDGMTFEEWASNLGYDADSRKAEKTFAACEDIGRRLIRTLGRECVEQLRDMFQDY